MVIIRLLIKHSPWKTAAEEFGWKDQKIRLLFSSNGGQLRGWGLRGSGAGCANGVGRTGKVAKPMWGKKPCCQWDPAGWRAGGRSGWGGSGWTLCSLGRGLLTYKYTWVWYNVEKVLINHQCFWICLQVPTYAGTEIDKFLSGRSGKVGSEKVRLE